MRLQYYFKWVIISGLLAFSGPALSEYDEGIEYKKVSPAVPNHTSSKLEVVELFWYGCPHCFHLEPQLHKWLKNKPANVNFVRIPAIFNKQWALHAKAYYTAEFLGIVDKIHEPLFNEIHVKKKHLHSAQALQAFFARYGVSKQDFESTFNSFAVDSKVRRALDLTRRYGINGVPAMVVNGKYMTDGPMANGNKGMLKMVDYLIKQESKK